MSPHRNWDKLCIWEASRVESYAQIYRSLPKIDTPKFDTLTLFVAGDRNSLTLATEDNQVWSSLDLYNAVNLTNNNFNQKNTLDLPYFTEKNLHFAHGFGFKFSFGSIESSSWYFCSGMLFEITSWFLRSSSDNLQNILLFLIIVITTGGSQKSMAP